MINPVYYIRGLELMERLTMLQHSNEAAESPTLALLAQDARDLISEMIEPPMPTRGRDWGEPVNYECDDRDGDRPACLTIQNGGNGDWYIMTFEPGRRHEGRGVRISTSGGASAYVPGLTLAICAAYDALYLAAPKHGASGMSGASIDTGETPI